MIQKKLAAIICAFSICATLASCSSAKPENSTTESTTSEFTFETKTGTIKSDGIRYDVYKNKPIKFDTKELSYDKLMEYKSPYDEYIDLYAIYKQITDSEVKHFGLDSVVEKAIVYAYENNIERIEIPVEYGSDTIMQGWNMAGIDYPHIPLTNTGCEIELTEDGFYRIMLSGTVRKTAAKSDEVIAAAKKIVDAMPADCKTDSDKAFYLYDWVCKNVGYDEYHTKNTAIVNNSPQSVYGALVEKRAVCDGIAGAIELLFNMADIPCGKIDGVSENMGHAWNYAIINGEVWDFDATWDIHRIYKSEDDKITDDNNDLGFYSWFGVSRNAKSLSYVTLSQTSMQNAPYTQYSMTENSPCMKVYDFVFSYDEKSKKDIIFVDGKNTEQKDFSVSDIQQKLDANGQVLLKFYDLHSMLDFWSQIIASDLIAYDKSNSDYYAAIYTVVLKK